MFMPEQSNGTAGIPRGGKRPGVAGDTGTVETFDLVLKAATVEAFDLVLMAGDGKAPFKINRSFKTPCRGGVRGASGYALA